MEAEEIAQRRQWALDHYFPPRAAERYAICDDPEEEEDWMDWYQGRVRSAERFTNLLVRNINSAKD